MGRQLADLRFRHVINFAKHPVLSLYSFQLKEAPNAIAAARKLLPECSEETLQGWRMEFLKDHAFFAELQEKQVTHRDMRFTCSRWYDLMYLMIRGIRPDLMIETGVFDGHSSAVILLAMRNNAQGQLISIDLPRPKANEKFEVAAGTYGLSKMNRTQAQLAAFAMPAGCEPGWVIPDSLKSRHRLEFGDARVLLPAILAETGSIDIFFHDSRHTYEHMLWEYQTAWPSLRPGGWLWSDDINLSMAFEHFARSQNRPYVSYQRLGVLQKP